MREVLGKGFLGLCRFFASLLISDPPMAWKTVPIINPDYQGDLVAIISEENGEGPVRINLRRDETINDMLRLKPKDASKPWLV